MRAFEVHLNGKRLCIAGVGDDGVLTAITNYVARKGRADMFLQVGGLQSGTEEHVRWVEQKALHVGDEIRVKIVEAASVDGPKKKYRTHPAETLKAQKRYVRGMAKKLGWEVRTRKSKSS